MTIAIATQVHDGVVLCSDSASTLTVTDANGVSTVVNVYNNANKIFNLVKGLPIGSATYGKGSFGSASISTLAKDLRRRFSAKDGNFLNWHVDPTNYTIEDIAIKAREFLYDENYKKYVQNPSSGFEFGFMVAGYSSDAQMSEVWSISIENGQCAPPKLVIAQGVADIFGGGDLEVFSRVVLGHSGKLASALVRLGLQPANVDAAIAQIRGDCFEPLIEAPMPIEDAIEFSEFLAHTTAMFTRFKRGAATVGGPIESAAITKHEGFKWVRRKHYFDQILNPPLVEVRHGQSP